ncbi:chorismate lyase [Candidatus Ruthia magnifica str. Cm (Calyptogena magnifica)]|uniref:Probable chorismate pyruvate-lyase n=1 Tax=Ruthia magnifica subsp. Calyptogena magnifica TaxID=413404 RepID=A1AXI5_RUTMC|nr:chorismate lyase [Candidatus Ruthturnera calyptogenae]ABL02642.1 chorismate lyase [Candidatus Ruthia magnifica str. Cm (Calyptogena magnifica)]
MINTKNLIWTNLNQVSNIPNHVLIWLNDHQSLTAKLKQKFNHFSINVLSQIESFVYANEAELLDWNGQSIVREVELLGDNQVVVFARSIIPITNDTKNLLKIGSKPLGEALFNDKSIKRSQLQITHTHDTWGRRSIFTIGSTQVLVSEFFIKNLYAV